MTYDVGGTRPLPVDPGDQPGTWTAQHATPAPGAPAGLTLPV